MQVWAERIADDKMAGGAGYVWWQDSVWPGMREIVAVFDWESPSKNLDAAEKVVKYIKEAYKLGYESRKREEHDKVR